MVLSKEKAGRILLEIPPDMRIIFVNLVRKYFLPWYMSRRFPITYLKEVLVNTLLTCVLSIIQKTIYLSCAIHRVRDIFSWNFWSSWFIGGNTKMHIQNSDFSYSNLKEHQRGRAGFVSVHNIIVSYSVRYYQTLIDWIFG